MLNTLRRRYPLARVVLAPVPVQGVEAPPAIAAAMEALNHKVRPDVILLARGGGSIEDLWAFNDERVARAITASDAPVITGVGHETDFTIADFVCDLRAPTPTGAAVLATPDRADLLIMLNELKQRLQLTVQEVMSSSRWSLDNLTGRLRLKSPRWRLLSDQQRLDEISRRAGVALEHHLELQHARLAALEQRLESLGPLSVMRRGYAVVTRADGRMVHSTRQVASGDELNVRVSDGAFQVQVIEPDQGGIERQK